MNRSKTPANPPHSIRFLFLNFASSNFFRISSVEFRLFPLTTCIPVFLNPFSVFESVPIRANPWFNFFSFHNLPHLAPGANGRILGTFGRIWDTFWLILALFGTNLASLGTHSDASGHTPEHTKIPPKPHFQPRNSGFWRFSTFTKCPKTFARSIPSTVALLIRRRQAQTVWPASKPPPRRPPPPNHRPKSPIRPPAAPVFESATAWRCQTAETTQTRAPPYCRFAPAPSARSPASSRPGRLSHPPRPHADPFVPYAPSSPEQPTHKTSQTHRSVRPSRILSPQAEDTPAPYTEPPPAATPTYPALSAVCPVQNLLPPILSYRFYAGPTRLV